MVFTGESALANKLCGTIGGILNSTNGTLGVFEGQRNRNGTGSGPGNATGGNGTTIPPNTLPPVAFTGSAMKVVGNGIFALVMGVLGTGLTVAV